MKLKSFNRIIIESNILILLCGFFTSNCIAAFPLENSIFFAPHPHKKSEVAKISILNEANQFFTYFQHSTNQTSSELLIAELNSHFLELAPDSNITMTQNSSILYFKVQLKSTQDLEKQKESIANFLVSDFGIGWRVLANQ